MKYREYWIEQFNGTIPKKLKAFNARPTDTLDQCMIRVNDGDPIAACEYFHTIEYAAYEDALKMCEELSLAISKLDHRIGFDINEVRCSFNSLESTKKQVAKEALEKYKTWRDKK